MAAFSQIALARDYWKDPAAFAKAHQAPWLIWSRGAPSEEPIIAPTTLRHTDVPVRPRTGEPVLFELVKGPLSSFSFGVTVGRTENNDVVIRHEEVSRFHCFVQLKDKVWMLNDADSRNGTFLDGRRLAKGHHEPLPEHSSVGLGGLALDCLLPEAMSDFLKGHLRLRNG